MEQFAERLARATLRHPRSIGAAVLLSTALAVALLAEFRIDPDVTRMLPQQSRRVQWTRALEPALDHRRQMFVILRGADLEQRVVAAAASLRQSSLLQAVAATRAEFFGAAVPDAPLWHLPEPSLAELRERLTTRLAATLRAGRERLAADPLAGRAAFVEDPLELRFLFADALRTAAPIALAPGSEFVLLAGRPLALLRVEGTQPPYDVDYSARLMADLEARLAGEECEYFGGYAIARAEAARSRADLQGSALGSLLMLGLFLIASMRRLWLPAVLLSTVALAVLWALPLGGLLLGPLTPIAISAAAVLIGLGIDFGLHYAAHYAAARACLPHGEAVVAAHRGSLRPLLAGMATTLVAFGALACGELTGLRGFALLLVLGLLAAFAATFAVMPFALAHLRGDVRAPQSRIVDALVALALGRGGRAAMLAVFALATAGAGAIALRGVRLSTDPDRLRPHAETAQREAIEAELGISPLAVLALVPHGQDSSGLAQGLARLQQEGRVRFAEGAPGPEQQPAVRTRVTALRGAVAGWRARAESALAALKLRVGAFAPALARIEAMLAADPTPLPPALVALGGRSWRQIRLFVPASFHDLPSWESFKSAVATQLGPEVELLAPIALMAELRDALRSDLWQALVLAGIGSLLVLALLLRGFGAAVLALLPAVCGLLVALGALAVAGVPLTPVNFVALPLLLGIGIDDGAHLVARAQQGERTLGPTGVAIWRTTVTTMLAFGSLCFATSPGLAELGWLVLLGVGTCLLTTLLTLPILLRLQPQPHP